MSRGRRPALALTLHLLGLRGQLGRPAAWGFRAIPAVCTVRAVLGVIRGLIIASFRLHPAVSFDAVAGTVEKLISSCPCRRDMNGRQVRRGQSRIPQDRCLRKPNLSPATSRANGFRGVCLTRMCPTGGSPWLGVTDGHLQPGRMTLNQAVGTVRQRHVKVSTRAENLHQWNDACRAVERNSLDSGPVDGQEGTLMIDPSRHIGARQGRACTARHRPDAGRSPRVGWGDRPVISHTQRQMDHRFARRFTSPRGHGSGRGDCPCADRGRFA